MAPLGQVFVSVDFFAQPGLLVLGQLLASLARDLRADEAVVVVVLGALRSMVTRRVLKVFLVNLLAVDSIVSHLHFDLDLGVAAVGRIGCLVSSKVISEHFCFQNYK